jgi:SAM-dependent methyltransferase
MQELTDEAFWDNFWAGIRLPDLIDPHLQWQGALTAALKAHLPHDPARHMFEVGCAPGRWLIWFNREFGYQAAGCDTSPRGLALTRQNLAMNGVEADLYEADLMSETLPEHAFDVIFSLGVIEHFTDPVPIIRRHLALLKPGGTLVLEVPNFAGKLNVRLMRAARLQPLLNAHNLEVMSRSFFESIARDYNLELDYLSYIGGFDPGMVVHNYPRRRGQRRGHPAVFYLLWGLERITRRMPRLAGRFNRPAFSNMLLGIFMSQSW